MKFIRRYQSEIYGNYRKAYLLDGVLTGLLIGGAVSFCKLIYYPIYAPENYVTDVVLLVCTLLFAYMYRSKLPDRKVTFKELILFGLGLGVVAAIVYGLFLMFYGGVIDKEFAGRCLDHFIVGEQNGAGKQQSVSGRERSGRGDCVCQRREEWLLSGDQFHRIMRRFSDLF